MKVYFCDPRSPWQRGANERTHCLLRQHFLKKTDLSMFANNNALAETERLAGLKRTTNSLDDLMK